MLWTLLASIAYGQHPFSVTVHAGTASISSAIQTGSEWAVAINAGGSPDGIFTLTTSGSSVDVSSITVNITGGTALMIVNETGGGTFDYITQISGLTSGTEELRIGTVLISGDLGSGGAGTIAAQVVNTLDIGGDLIADVIAGPRATSGATISAIELIRVDGNITGDVTANYGYVLDITVGGNIGSAGNNVTIDTRDGIDEIIADSIWANINAQANSGSGSLYRLETTAGDFVGSLSTQWLTTKVGVADPGVFVTGDLEAPITIDEDLRTFLDVEGSVDANITVTQQLRGLVRIGASLLSGRTISAQALTESGIDGQIIINALNVSGTWSGNVTVNSTTLATKPHYSNTGLGGAVGLAVRPVRE